MEIGILTFHNAYNYGAVLQTIATQLVIGIEKCYVIDYHNKTIDESYEKYRFKLKYMPKSLTAIALWAASSINNRFRIAAFKRFNKKYMRLTAERYNEGTPLNLNQFDLVLVGSDQLWNKKLTGGFDNVYWGDFKVAPGGKKASWSVSMNYLDIDEAEKEYIHRHLNNFSAISVREDSLQRFLQPLTPTKIHHTIDPTLLLSATEWGQMCKPVKEKNYIAVYAIRNGEETLAFARQLAKRMNKKLIIIKSASGCRISKEFKHCLGPDGFLSYIKYADYVVTTSFHGSVFSIVFNRQFCCPYFEKNSRVESLLYSFGIENRIIKTPDEAIKLKSIDYAEIEKQLSLLQEQTRQFLNSL